MSPGREESSSWESSTRDGDLQQGRVGPQARAEPRRAAAGNWPPPLSCRPCWGFGKGQEKEFLCQEGENPSSRGSVLPVVRREGTHRGDVGVVCHHQPADAVCGGQVGGFAGQSHLDAGRTPGDEVGQLSLPDPLQALVNLVGREQQGGEKHWAKQPQELLFAGYMSSERRISANSRDKRPSWEVRAHAGATWSQFSGASGWLRDPHAGRW